MARAKKDRYGLRGEVHFQMAPLIDVVFLLLIFFITVSTFYETDKVDLILAYAKTAKELKEGEGTLTVNVTAKGEILVNGLPFTGQGALQVYMQKLATGVPNYKVDIRADRDAHWKEIKDVYRAAAHAGLTRISLVTQTRQGEEQGQGVGAPVSGEKKPGEEDLIY
jgi:biopolymer transport protein ExbD